MMVLSRYDLNPCNLKAMCIDPAITSFMVTYLGGSSWTRPEGQEGQAADADVTPSLLFPRACPYTVMLHLRIRGQTRSGAFTVGIVLQDSGSPQPWEVRRHDFIVRARLIMSPGVGPTAPECDITWGHCH